MSFHFRTPAARYGFSVLCRSPLGRASLESIVILLVVLAALTLSNMQARRNAPSRGLPQRLALALSRAKLASPAFLASSASHHAFRSPLYRYTRAHHRPCEACFQSDSRIGWPTLFRRFSIAVMPETDSSSRFSPIRLPAGQVAGRELISRS